MNSDHDAAIHGAPCYDVVDEMEKRIDAEIEAWREFKAKQSD